MNRTELVAILAEKSELPKSSADKLLAAFIETVTDELKKEGNVALVGFGTFQVTKRAARTGRNPQTGAEIKIAASNQPVFKAGKGLKEALN